MCEVDEPQTEHERLVAYVRALDEGPEARAGVWGEHSYALGAARPARAALRRLLAPRAPSPPPAAAAAALDVERAPRPPSPPSPPRASDSDSDGGGSEPDGWEERAAAAAPAAGGARLLQHALDALRRLRLARLAAGRRGLRVALDQEARRLRLRLAAEPSAPLAWLPTALEAHAPPPQRRAARRLLARVRRLAPSLAARLGPGAPPAPPPAAAPPGAGGPWLAWVGSAQGRWARRLGSLLEVRAVPLRAGPAPPEQWCGALAASVRAAIDDIHAQATAAGRALVVGGAGAGAALAAACGGAGAARLLLAPPAPGPAAAAPAPPALLVLGALAPGAGRAPALAGARRRVLVVGGADRRLRLAPHAARRRRLPQAALDAAIAEECVRWIHEVCEPPPPGDAAGAPRAECEDEEYAHLSLPTPQHAPPPASGNRSIEIVEGRVVRSGAGVGPGAGAGAAGAEGGLAVTDIINLPIVFADDERTLPAAGPPPLTVTSGGGAAVGGAGGAHYTRVIVAKRGGRPLVLRRPLRIVPRD